MRIVVIWIFLVAIATSAFDDTHEPTSAETEGDAPRFAVATLVAGGTRKHGGQDGYTIGAVSLAGSLRAAAAAAGVELVALVTDDVSPGNRAALARAGWMARPVPSLEARGFGFTKLRAWSHLPEYSKVLFLDADTTAARAEPLLALLPAALRQNVGFAAAPDILPSDRLNSGVMLLDPSPQVGRAILRIALPADEAEAGRTEQEAVVATAAGTTARLLDGRYAGDQDLIRDLFPAWWNAGALGPGADDPPAVPPPCQGSADGDGDGGGGGFVKRGPDGRWRWSSPHAHGDSADFAGEAASPSGNTACGEQDFERAAAAASTAAAANEADDRRALCAVKVARLGAAFNALVAAQSVPAAAVYAAANVIHWTGTKPWSVWQVEAGHGLEGVEQAGMPGWGTRHPMYALHETWRRFYVLGNQEG